MKGYISVDFPTKPYIKAYLIHQLGKQPMLDTTNKFGNKLYDLFGHITNERKSQFSSSLYSCTIRIYISKHVFYKRGACLNETNIKNFNQFAEADLKDKFYFLMDLYTEFHPSFEANLPEVRRILGIDIEAWADDSMKKAYYRYRIKNGKPLFKTKIISLTVPSEAYANMAF